MVDWSCVPNAKFPNWPRLFHPQHHTVPTGSTAHAWLKPVASVSACAPIEYTHTRSNRITHPRRDILPRGNGKTRAKGGRVMNLNVSATPNFRGNRGRARYSNGETRPRGLRSRGYVSRHTRYARYTPHVRVRCVALTSDRHVFRSTCLRHHYDG